MRRLAPPAVLAAALAAVLGAVLAAPAPAAGHVALRASLAACATGDARDDRRAAFRATMPDRPGASVLAMRFTLQRRTAAGWRHVPAPTFDRWERSEAGAPGLVYTKEVAGLPTPGRYRARVRFAWRDAAGRVVAGATRRTRSCRQPDRRPDLRPLAIAVVRRDGARATYVVRVVNEGRGALEDPADVALRVGAAAPVRAPLGTLGRGAGADVVLEGPACVPGDVLRAVADPAGDVRERDEADGALQIACPG